MILNDSGVPHTQAFEHLPQPSLVGETHQKLFCTGSVGVRCMRKECGLWLPSAIGG